MKQYSFVTDRIEVRASNLTGSEPQYVVRGYASIPNKKDIYKYQKTPNGIKSFKSLFTDNAIASMKKQAKAKKVFVDAEHKIATEINVRSILEEVSKKTGTDITEETNQISDFLKFSQLPLARVEDIIVDDNGLFVDTRMNPSFKELEPKYFNAVWNSLQQGFLNGISINFSPTKVQEQFVDGEWVTVIDDLDLYGFSYTGQPALADNSILEVAMRSAMEVRQSMKGEKMTEQQSEQKVQQAVEQIPTVPVSEYEKLKQENEALKQSQVNKEKESYQKQIEDLKKQLEEKQAVPVAQPEQRPIARGIVSSSRVEEDQSSQRPFVDSLKELSLGEKIHLQHEFNTNRYRDEATYKLLGRSPSDIVVQRK